MRKTVFVCINCHCINCHQRLQIELLSPEEAAELHRRGIPTGRPTCPRCGHPMIEER